MSVMRIAGEVVKLETPAPRAVGRGPAGVEAPKQRKARAKKVDASDNLESERQAYPPS